MGIGLIFTALFLVLIALATIVGYCKGKKYVWQYTLTRLIINVTAVLISIPLTRFVALKAVGYILTKVPLNSMGDTADILKDDLTVAMGVVEALAAMVLGIVFFFFIRIIVKFVLKFFKYAIFSIISAISDAISGKNKKQPEAEALTEETEGEKTSELDATTEEEPTVIPSAPARKRGREGCYALKPQLVSILIGIIGCIFGVVVVFAPFTGVIGLADEALTEVGSSLEEGDEDYEIYLTAREFTNNLSVRFSNKFGGKLIFNGLTTYKVNGTKIKLRNEVNLATTIVTSAETIMNEEATKDAQKSAVSDIMNAFDRSSVIPLVLADVVNQVAISIEEESELANSLNIKSDDGELTGTLVLELVSSFKGCTPESIKADVRTLGDIVLIVIEHGAIDAMDNPEDLLSNKALIEELLTAFFENDRLGSLVSTFVELGIDMLENELGMTDTLEKAHENMIAKLGAVDTRADDEAVATEVTKILTSYGVDVTKDSAYQVASALKLNGAHAALSSVTVNGENTPVNLSSPEGFKKVSLLLTKSEVKIIHKDSIKDPKNEAKLIAEALSSITTLTSSMEDEIKVSSLLETAGTLLDNLAKTEMVGKDVVDKLIVVMFQSDKMSDVLPMNTVEITKFVDSLVSGSNGKENGYETVMGGIADMVESLEMFASTDANDNPVEAITKTLENITPESAEALKHFATTDFVKEIGVGEENAEGVANVLGNLFDELATAKDAENGLGLKDEEYTEETEKISKLLDVTMSITDGSKDTSEVDFNEYVNDVMGSKILTNTIINSVYDENGTLQNDPLNTGIELSENEKTDLVASLNTKLNDKLSEITSDENASEEEKAEKIAETENLIVALGAYMNTSIVVEDGEVKIAN